MYARERERLIAAIDREFDESFDRLFHRGNKVQIILNRPAFSVSPLVFGDILRLSSSVSFAVL
jgi:hypothetical protein